MSGESCWPEEPVEESSVCGLGVEGLDALVFMSSVPDGANAWRRMEESESRGICDVEKAEVVVTDSTVLSGRCAGAKIDLVSEDLFAKSVKRLTSSGWPISPERPKANTETISAMVFSSIYCRFAQLEANQRQISM